MEQSVEVLLMGGVFPVSEELDACMSQPLIQGWDWNE